MFARRKVGQDIQSSLQRFADLSRDCISRTKHLRLTLEAITVPQDRRQFFADFEFELFHLVESLIMHHDPVDMQILITPAESALFTLEQLLIYAPERIGKGWQRRAIEFIIKRAFHPQNVIAIRLYAIRLFLIWYQCLAAHGNVDIVLDAVFQFCIPDFPSPSGQICERFLIDFCENNILNPAIKKCMSRPDSNNLGPRATIALPLVINKPNTPTPVEYYDSNDISRPSYSSTEKTKSIKDSVDTFLEYCSSKIVEIEWAEPARQMDCAQFILDRVIILYIYELFPTVSCNGYESSRRSHSDFSDLERNNHIVFIKSSFIQWFIDIVSERHQHSFKSSVSQGLSVLKQVLLSSQKAVTVLFSLMHEAMNLPCHFDVIKSVLQLIRLWLLQFEMPKFVDSGLVEWKEWNSLLTRIPFLFFTNPNIASQARGFSSPADKFSLNILQIFYDLSNPFITTLSRPLPIHIWHEIIRLMNSSMGIFLSRTDQFADKIVGDFSRTLLSVCVFVQAYRGIQLEDIIWDELAPNFIAVRWLTVVKEWSQIIENLRNQLIIPLFHSDNFGFNNRLSFSANNLSLNSKQIAEQILNNSTSSDFRLNKKLSLSRNNLMAENYNGAGNIDTEFENDCCNISDYSMDFIRHSQHPNVTQIIAGQVYPSVQNNENIVFPNVNKPLYSEALLIIKTYLRLICLVNPLDEIHSRQAVQTISREIGKLVDLESANLFVRWLCQLVFRSTNISSDCSSIVPVLCSVLINSGPTITERSQLISLISDSLKFKPSSASFEGIFRIPLQDFMAMEEDTISSLKKLITNGEFSNQAIKIATLLALSNPEAKNMVLSFLTHRRSSEFADLHSLTDCINSICILIIECSDVQLFLQLFQVLADHPQSKKLLPIFCHNLSSVNRAIFLDHLTVALRTTLSLVDDVAEANDIQWLSCSIAAREPRFELWPSLIEISSKRANQFFEAMLLRLFNQFPLPGFEITQWSSIYSPPMSCQLPIFAHSNNAILSLEDDRLLCARTVIGRNCYKTIPVKENGSNRSPLNNVLRKLANSLESEFKPNLSARRKSDGSSLIDPFKTIPYPRIRSHPAPGFNSNDSKNESQLDIKVKEMLEYVKTSSRLPEFLETTNHNNKMFNMEANKAGSEKTLPSNFNLIHLRELFADLNLVDSVKEVPSNFNREIRHLDLTPCREFHKVAVLYVGEIQEDKQSILSNSSGSENFNKFVGKLGWPVMIGSSDFFGYCGGLNNGQIAPYYATANTEVIFHVSTWLSGDNTQKIKHLGNDEVHVVWSENTKPYRKESLTTQFCDVLIVLYVVSPVLIRIHIETKDSRLLFGPLFDGACIHMNLAADLVRETVVNASRSYRNNREGYERPNKHREKVFAETRNLLHHQPLASSITRLLRKN